MEAIILLTEEYSEGELSQDSHLLQLLSEVVHWISPPEAVVAAIKCGKSERY